MSEREFVAVAQVADVPPGAKTLVTVGGVEIVLCHTLDRLFACRNLCSHAYEKLDGGRVKNGWISCPVHGARFDLETGQPMNQPAVMPIDVFAVKVEGDTILVAAPAS